MADDVLDERHLDVRRVLDRNHLTPLLNVEVDGFVGENREDNAPTVADNLNAVGSCRLMSAEAPSAAAWQTIGELESGTDRVLGLVEPGAVGIETNSTRDGAEEFLQEIKLMRREVVEIATACNVALHAPREIAAIVVDVARRHSKANLNADDFTYPANFVKDNLNTLLALKRSDNVCFSINFPSNKREEIKGVRFATLGLRKFSDRYELQENRDGSGYLLLGEPIPLDNSSDSDVELIKQGYITVTPVSIQDTAREFFDAQAEKKLCI